MKDEYLIWKRVQDSSKHAINDAEMSLFLNKDLLQHATRKIKELERAGKVPQNATAAAKA